MYVLWKNSIYSTNNTFWAFYLQYLWHAVVTTVPMFTRQLTKLSKWNKEKSAVFKFELETILIKSYLMQRPFFKSKSKSVVCFFLFQHYQFALLMWANHVNKIIFSCTSQWNIEKQFYLFFESVRCFSAFSTTCSSTDRPFRLRTESI